MQDESTSATDWFSRARALRPDVRPWIDGQRVSGVGEGCFASHDPATGDVVAELPACGAAEIDAAVQAARGAFESGAWSGLSPRERGRRLHRFAEAITRHVEELALLDSREMGMPIALAVSDLPGAAELVRVAAESADKLIDGVIPNDPATLLLNVREPVGVVGAITPWNFPAYIGISKIAPALAVGNSVVLKPSELASLSCLRLGELAAEAGIPDGVLNVVPGPGASAGNALALHGDVDLLTFTGSTATGKALLRASGQSNMKRLILECGGKSPQIVFADAPDLDAVADAVVASITFNSGQVCVAGSRLLVERSVHDALLERVLTRAAAIRAGNPLDEATTFGPLASVGQLARVRGFVESGLAEGAVARLDGSRGLPGQGCYWLPTVFTGVQRGMRIAGEEIFGPVLSTLTFDTEDEAISLANATPFGLVATLWSGNLARGHRLARRIRAGLVAVNAGASPGPMDATAGAFEPHGQSGLGVEGGLEGMRAFTRLKGIALSG